MVVAAAATPLVVVAPYALAAWLSTGIGSGVAAAASMQPVSSAPVVSSVGSAARVTWTGATLDNGADVEGYRVLRHVGGTTGTACTSTTSLSCDDLEPSSTSSRYGVVAYRGNWTSAESPLSAASVYGDAIAPSTTISRNPSGSDSTWNKQDVVVTLTATDAASGVKEIRYTVNGGVEVVAAGATTTFTLSREDANALVYWAVDNAGNAENPKNTAAVMIDKTAPSTTATPSSASTPNPSGYYTKDVTVTLVGTDQSPAIGGAASGVTNTEYQLGSSSGTWSTYSSPVTVSSDGTTTIYFRSTDLAGNVEASKSLTVKLDKTVPSLNTPTITGTSGTNGWYKGVAAPTVALGATDATSGVAKVEYQIGGTSGKWTTYGSTPVTVTESLSYDIYYRATDNAGNASAAVKQSVKYDATPPTAPTLSLSPANPDGLSQWYTTAPTASLSGGTDNLSGIALRALLSGVTGAKVNDSTSPSGTTLTYQSTDGAGNVSAVGTTSGIKVDTVLPTVSDIYPSTGGYTKNQVWSAGATNAGGTCAAGLVCADATDGQSGVASVSYTLVLGTTCYIPNGTNNANTATVGSSACSQPMSFASGAYRSATAMKLPNSNNVTFILTVTVVDAAGNIKTSSTSLTT